MSGAPEGVHQTIYLTPPGVRVCFRVFRFLPFCDPLGIISQNTEGVILLQ